MGWFGNGWGRKRQREEAQEQRPEPEDYVIGGVRFTLRLQPNGIALYSDAEDRNAMNKALDLLEQAIVARGYRAPKRSRKPAALFEQIPPRNDTDTQHTIPENELRPLLKRFQAQYREQDVVEQALKKPVLDESRVEIETVVRVQEIWPYLTAIVPLLNRRIGAVSSEMAGELLEALTETNRASNSVGRVLPSPEKKTLAYLDAVLGVLKEYDVEVSDALRRELHQTLIDSRTKRDR